MFCALCQGHRLQLERDNGRSSTGKCMSGPHSHEALNLLLYIGSLYYEPMYQLPSGQPCEVDAIVIPILQIRRLRPIENLGILTEVG